MFGKKELIKLSVLYYYKDTIIGTKRLDGKKIVVPISTDKASIVEYHDNNLDNRVINNYYVGDSINLKILLETSTKTVEISSSIDDLELRDIDNTSVLYCEKNNKIIVNKVLAKEERVFSNYKALESHLDKLSIKLKTLYKDSNDIKTLIYKK